MNHEEFTSKASQLTLTAAGFGAEVDSMDEAPPNQISKFSWYLVNSRASGAGVKVVRHAVLGWGEAQRASLVQQAELHANEEETAMTSVVHSYGDDSRPIVQIDCFFKRSKTTFAFPYIRRDGKLEYQPTLEEQQGPVRAAMQDWAAKTVKKKLFGLF
jgi:hypothetical protein